MLKNTVIQAVATARKVFGDLLADAVLVKREATTYVPGTTPQYPETEAPIKVYISRFITREIEDDRIAATDFRAIVFPVDAGAALLPQAVPAVNDVIRIGERSYRVISPDNVMAGDQPVLNESRIRLQ